MAGDLDHIFGSVGAWRREVRSDDVIDGVAVRVRQRCERGGPGLPCRGLIEKSQNTFDYRARIGTGDADDADAATAGRRRDSRDGITGSHNENLREED